MAGFFSRLGKIFESEAHTAASRLEEPIRMTEQGIRDLKGNLNEAVISLAQVKSVAIRLRREADEEARRAADYGRKAETLVIRGRSGELASAESDRLASEALRLKTTADERHTALKARAEQQEGLAERFQGRVAGLRREVSRFEDDLITLRARSRAATTAKKINQHLAGADTSSTVAMLERMRDKVAEEEALAEAYGQLGDDHTSADDEIDRALRVQDGVSSVSVQGSLAELKARLGADETRD